MKESRVDALIQLMWLTEREGGRKSIPKGQIFAANMRFEGNELLWSIVIFLGNSIPDENRMQTVKVGFLFRENLEGKLSTGKQVVILEGPQKIIAKGEILSVYEK